MIVIKPSDGVDSDKLTYKENRIIIGAAKFISALTGITVKVFGFTIIVKK